MKTKLYSMPDWQESLEQMGFDGAPTRADVDEAVRRELGRGRITFQAADIPIEAGCRVTIKTVSALPKYNRERTVLLVGGGLYDTIIEARLLGMRRGERGSAVVRGETVEFSVTQVERKVYPQFTDQLVAEQGIDGVGTVEEYRAYTEENLRRAYAQGLCQRLCGQLIAGAAMEQPDEGDIRAVIDQEYESLRRRFSHGGEDLDAMTPEQWRENFYRPELKASYEQIYPEIAPLMDTTSKQSYYENRRAPAQETIRECLVLRKALGEEGADTDPTAELSALPTLRRRMEERLYAILCEKGCEH